MKDNMSWKDFKAFAESKLNEYKEEIKDGKELQDNQKKFFEEYLSKEKQSLMALEGLLKGDKAEVSENSTTNPGEYSGTNQEQFWQFFIADGYSKESVAGMMGNIQQESNFQIGAVENTATNAGEGHGLVQWSFERKTALKEYAKKKNKDWQDFQIQIEYLKIELDGPEKNSLTGGTSAFKKLTNVDTATIDFCDKFERPNALYADKPNRLKWANKFYNEFKDKKFTNSGKAAGGKLLNPTTNGVVTSAYKQRINPITGENKWHAGIDIGGSGPIMAAADGKVVLRKFDPPGYGWYIIIDHGTVGGKNMKTLYGHMLENLVVNVGDTVKAGDKIGTMGSTGGSTGVHLHFEVHLNDQHVDSRPYVNYKDA